MSGQEFWVVIGIGIFFLVLGIVVFFLGNKEEGSWYDSLVTRFDVREYVERDTRHPEPAALRIGGFICLAVGIIAVAVALILRFLVK